MSASIKAIETEYAGCRSITDHRGNVLTWDNHHHRVPFRSPDVDAAYRAARSERFGT